jgi:hypothetical protein
MHQAPLRKSDAPPLAQGGNEQLPRFPAEYQERKHGLAKMRAFQIAGRTIFMAFLTLSSAILLAGSGPARAANNTRQT